MATQNLDKYWEKFWHEFAMREEISATIEMHWLGQNEDDIESL